MSKFSFNKSKNPVNETYPCQPKGKEPITLNLKPIDTDIEFMILRFQRMFGSSDIDQAIWQIGSARIQGWENVQDENGVPVVFNPQTFGQWLDLGEESMPYVMDVGEYTLNQRFPDRQKKTEPEVTQNQPEMPSEVSENSSETTLQE